LTGLAATLHHRLKLRPGAIALEVGGACTGFLAALGLARMILPRTGPVLILSVEAPSRWLPIQPGSAGEAAALFGDAAAAALVTALPMSKAAVPLNDVMLGADGSAGRLLQVDAMATGGFRLNMDGRALAGKAVTAMAEAVHRIVERNELALAQVQGIVGHGGNGRLPALLARRLGLALQTVWSATALTGNLGSASLPVAWASHSQADFGPVVWSTVGAGLTWAVALTGLTRDCSSEKL
jgi:3-oxoacyl-[acyl-carrier-protein] synthase-3